MSQEKEAAAVEKKMCRALGCEATELPDHSDTLLTDAAKTANLDLQERGLVERVLKKARTESKTPENEGAMRHYLSSLQDTTTVGADGQRRAKFRVPQGAPARNAFERAATSGFMTVPTDFVEQRNVGLGDFITADESPRTLTLAFEHAVRRCFGDDEDVVSHLPAQLECKLAE